MCITASKRRCQRKPVMVQAAARNACSRPAPAAENDQPSVLQLGMTVSQNTIWNDGFFDLWRSSLCAASAPGQRPAMTRPSSMTRKAIAMRRAALLRPADLAGGPRAPANATGSNRGR
jgi:hypothetical protein